MIISQNWNYWVKILISFIKTLFLVCETNTKMIGNIEVTNTTDTSCYLFLPSHLTGFTNTNTDTFVDKKGRPNYIFNGTLEIRDEDRICDICGGKMHVNGNKNIKLKHLPFGGYLTHICFPCAQLECQHCHATKMQGIPFKCEGHFITNELCTYSKDLLATGNYTNVEVSHLTGINRNLVKEIDMKRLKEKYTIDGKELIKPEQQANYLSIDEFKLHDGYKYATHIINLETGHVLWIQEGKKKQVVYDFMEHVGDEWMKNVVAVACDMNSDFEEAFVDKFPNIAIVFDHFHIIKNFNEKVISAIRKDEQSRLVKEGKKEEAKTLKKSRYILTSSKETLKKKDQEAKDGKVILKGSTIFHTTERRRKGGNEARNAQIIKENELILTAEIIREKVSYAYTLENKKEMAKEIDEIIEMCNDADNKHLTWFANLLTNHYDGIISHADYKISSGKIEGINNKIKTVRRQAYGYPDDEYFFLKIFDISRVDR